MRDIKNRRESVEPMMRFLKCVLQLWYVKLKLLKMQLDVIALHGFYLPQGSGIFHPKNVSIGKNFGMSQYCQLYCQDPDSGSKLIIKDDVRINNNVLMIADHGGQITIGSKTMIGPNTILRAANHKFDNVGMPIQDQGYESGIINIEDDVWIGASVTILKNVNIGRSSVIGAGSVVTRDIPPYSIAVGNPAKVIRSRK